MADPTQFWSAIFMFYSENGRWQTAISNSACICTSGVDVTSGNYLSNPGLEEGSNNWRAVLSGSGEIASRRIDNGTKFLRIS